jgi:hypothetical protein
MRLLTILARFGTEQYPHAEEEIAGIFARQMPTVDRSVVVVDNALPREFVQERGRHWLLGGDNHASEFSAFDRALNYLGSEIWSYDLIHFATSAFNTLYVAYLERFDTKLLESISERPACVGHIDCYNEAVDIMGFRSQHWIRSCFFVMPPAEARILGSLVSVSDGSRFFSGRPDAPFLPDAPISAAYRSSMRDWITGGDIGQGVTWHSSFPLNAATLASFERKALCIINEHLLAIRLRALGCRVVDVTWLSTQLSGRGAQAVPWRTSWSEQLAGRDRDRLLFQVSA